MECPILCYGEIDLDWYLAVNMLPSVTHDAYVQDEIHNTGGAAANAAIWLAHWGIPVRLAGHLLGDDADGAFIRAQIARYPLLDSRYIVYQKDIPTPRCQCLVTPNGERSFIVHSSRDTAVTPLTPEMLQAVTWLNLDMSGPKSPRIEAAQLAHTLGVSVLVNDVYVADHPVLEFADIVILSASLFQRKSNGTALRELVSSVQQAGGCDVIVTNGGQPVWAVLRNGDEVSIQPPPAPIVDTTGAGDIFKAGLLYGLCQGLSVQQALPWAVAAGTVKAGRAGTTADPADLATVQELMLMISEQIM